VLIEPLVDATVGNHAVPEVLQRSREGVQCPVQGVAQAMRRAGLGSGGGVMRVVCVWVAAIRAAIRAACVRSGGGMTGKLRVCGPGPGGWAVLGLTKLCAHLCAGC
jgi:hypothetical protein